MMNFKNFIVWGTGLFLSVLLGNKVLLFILLLLNVIDMFTGISNAYITGNKLTAEKGFKGIVKKINKLLYIVVAVSIDIAILNQLGLDVPITQTTVFLMVINELLSIVLNISHGDIKKVPKPIQKILMQLKQEYLKEDKENDDNNY